jgi:leucyl/phenylalanyl-tRNA--protein transferase
MFHRADDASKVALVHLDRHLSRRGFTLLDCQMVTSVTRSLGAQEISRADYLGRLARAVDQPSRW